MSVVYSGNVFSKHAFYWYANEVLFKEMRYNGGDVWISPESCFVHSIALDPQIQFYFLALSVLKQMKWSNVEFSGFWNNFVT